MIISLDDFRDWLESKPAEAKVGAARSNLRCPVSRCIAETGAEFIYPDQLMPFVDALDETGLKDVTAGQALGILRNTRN